MIYKGFMVAMLTFTFLLVAHIGNLVIEYEEAGVLEVVEYDCYLKSAVLPEGTGWDPEVQLSMVCRMEVADYTDEEIGEPPNMYVNPPIPLVPKTEGT
jgi:hypothetical protein